MRQSHSKKLYFSLLVSIFFVAMLVGMSEAALAINLSGVQVSNPLGSNTTFFDILKVIVNWLLGLVGVLALLALVIGGARMIVSFGNEDGVRSGKRIITWAVIGLTVVILSYAIIAIVSFDLLGV